jgi:site-specific recombinase XerD
MNSFCTWLKEEGHIAEPIKLKLIKAPLKVINVFSEADIRSIVSFKPRGFYQLRTWSILQTLLDTGCRIDEILSLRVDKVNFDSLLLTVLGKGNKERQIPFSLELRKVLWRYRQVEAKRQHSFALMFSTSGGAKLSYTNTLRDVRILCRRVGITKHVHLHLTRHSFACHFMKNGGSIYTLSRLLGHSSVSTTQTYIRGLGVEDFQAEHARLSPLARH